MPVAVSGITDALSVSAGGFHSCALLADKTVKCWGGNWYGQLGNGTTTDSPVPVLVSGFVAGEPTTTTPTPTVPENLFHNDLVSWPARSAAPCATPRDSPYHRYGITHGAAHGIHSPHPSLAISFRKRF